MTEEANVSGNALDMPTSVWSEMTRKQVEPLIYRTANDGQRQLADASGRTALEQYGVVVKNFVSEIFLDLIRFQSVGGRSG